ncbi:DUF4292 domain-containing protein [Mucilaginibacter sp.]|uniref:DUF4292 domain-containing protein n=1 Tax=Mucilaginibacter sp. TaxID=1882438 RepID=UPI0026032909|nr:DUF4292 domain-containing protein [Mucilaginibacter sp.]MDB5030911.1 hypothetical protein [Mucilaginibacter sp.]
MKRNILNNLLLVYCILTIISCKAHKQLVPTPRITHTITTPTTTPDETLLRNQLAAIKGRQIVFNTFSGRANTKLNINGDSNDVTLNIRISRDKEIWVSITALLGIEVARAVITPDSIKIVNKLQGLYTIKSFSYIYEYASKQVNYKTLESLLVGNAMPELLNENTSLQTDNGNITLSGNLQDLIYKLMLGPDMKVSQFNLANQSAGQSLQVNNTNFIQAANRIIPSQIDISSIIKDKKILANLHYTKVDFDQQLEFPFNIPERYAPAN